MLSLAVAVVTLAVSSVAAQDSKLPETSRLSGVQHRTPSAADSSKPTPPADRLALLQDSQSGAADGGAARSTDGADVPLPEGTAVILFRQAPPSDDQVQGSGLLPRKLTDIRPSLDYAWGDTGSSELPDEFYVHAANDVNVRIAPRLTVLHWAPTNAWYQPLYFEDPALERYGHSYHPLIQPIASTGHFLGQAVGLPYQAALRPPHSREYPLGWYRPGECAPKLRYKVPFNEEAVVTQALAVVGLVFLIP